MKIILVCTGLWLAGSLAAQTVPAEASADRPAAPAAAAAAGPLHFWFGMHPDFVAEFDPVTDQVLRKIHLRNGMAWDVNLTWDRKRFLIVTGRQEKVEVVDRAAGAVVDEHSFAEDGFIIRVRDVRELPGGDRWYVQTERIKKHPDRYSFEPGQWLLYDPAAKKVEKKMRRLPEPLDRARISPDGKTWHVTTDDGDLAIHDPKTLKEIARIDLHTPRFAGAGAIRTGQDLFDGRNPDAQRLLYTMEDPVQRGRTQWGVLDLDLVQNKITKVSEWGLNPSVFFWRIAGEKPIGAAMGGGFGGGGDRDRRTKLALYDLTTGTKLKETQEEFRPRRHLAGISPDGSKLYIGGAGSDFEVFDADLKRLKTVELDGEVAGSIYVLGG